MALFNKRICDNCHQEILPGEKYFTVQFRVLSSDEPPYLGARIHAESESELCDTCVRGGRCNPSLSITNAHALLSSISREGTGRPALEWQK